MARRLLRPRSWPLAAKITADLLLASLVPLLLAVWLTSSRADRQLDREARQSIGLLAGVTAAQLDQLISDTRRLLVQASKDVRLEQFCAGDAAQRDLLREEIARKLRIIVGSNPDFASMFLTDASGIGIAATRDSNLGMDFRFREYCTRALAGETYVSEMLVGKTSDQPGIYVAAPIHAPGSDANPDAPVVGCAVLKLDGGLVWKMIDAIRVGQRGHALLSDADGVVIAAPEKALLYRSFDAIDPARIAEIDPQTTWGKPTIEPLGIPALMQVKRERKERRGTAAFDASAAFAQPAGDRWIAGYCWMAERDWLVSIVQPQSEFTQSLSDLVRERVLIVLVVGALAAALAVWRARGIVRPVAEVADAAHRLAEGDFSVRAAKSSDDEIGRLADAFNHMVPHLKERVDLQQSLAVAMEVQKSLLPAADPTPARLDVAGRSRYCDATGGDYYDFLDIARVSDTGAMIAVGDVMGHGVASALLMATARAALRAHANDDPNLASLMMKVNRVLAADARHNRFMTMALVVIDPARGTARWASAGHDPTIVFHPDTNTFEEFEGGGVPLGMIEDEVYEQYSRDGLRAGDVLVIGTDGIWEMANPENQLFGKDRLREIIRAHHARPAREIADTLERELAAFRGPASVQDDVTFVVIKIK
jgi:serine phosphatase RsbU (regulator of sigma subunit)